jgi:hypothetical protein
MFSIALSLGCRLGFDRSTTEVRDAAEGDGAGQADARVDGQTIDAVVDAAPVTCPGNYVTLGVGSSVYRLETNSVTWLSAEQSCEADGQHLVIVDDVTELDAVAAAIPGENIWVGVTDRKTIGTWLKVTGGAATYLPWDSSEPDLADFECVYLDAVTLKFVDQGCTSGRRAVCECDTVPPDPTSY